MHKEPRALITDKQTWNGYCRLTLRAGFMASEAQPGQFLMVRPSQNTNPLLRRPFSIHTVKDDHVEIFFLKSGPGTTLLSEKEKGETLDILGPLGKGFLLNNELTGKKVALIAGGRGIAPLYFLAQKLRERGSFPGFYYGGKTVDDLPLKEKLQVDHFDVHFSTDNGSYGFKGQVTDLFTKALRHYTPFHIFACGPEAMMKTTAQLAAERNIPGQFSLESIMGCGFGACWGCVRKIRTDAGEEWIKICEEGPVFSGNQIVWKDQTP